MRVELEFCNRAAIAENDVIAWGRQRNSIIHILVCGVVVGGCAVVKCIRVYIGCGNALAQNGRRDVHDRSLYVCVCVLYIRVREWRFYLLLPHGRVAGAVCAARPWVRFLQTFSK